MAAFTPDPERRDELFGQIREMRKDSIAMRRSIDCMYTGMTSFREKYAPMLDEMMETRRRMTALRWAVYTAAAVGGLTGLFLWLKFVGLLMWEWIRRQS